MRTSRVIATLIVSTILSATAPFGIAEAAPQPTVTFAGPWAVATLATDGNGSTIESYKIDKNLIAWTETNGSGRKLFAYDGVSTHQLADMAKSDWQDDGLGFYDAARGNFDVAGGLVVWTMGDGHDREIYGWNGEKIFKVSDNSYDDRHPVTAAGRVAWTSQPGTVYNLMVKDASGIHRLDSYQVLNYAFSGKNLFWMNLKPGESWFHVVVNDGRSTVAIGEGDDRPMPKYFTTDGKGSAAWEYSTKNWSYDKRIIYLSLGGVHELAMLQRDVPPNVTRLEDVDGGKVAVNALDLLYTRLDQRNSFLLIEGMNQKTVSHKDVASKVRFMDGGYVRHLVPDTASPLLYAAPTHEDYVSMDPVILDRFDADGPTAAGARLGGGVIAFTNGETDLIPTTHEAASIAVKNGDIAWIEGEPGDQTLRFATTAMLVQSANGAMRITGYLVKTAGDRAVYLAGSDGTRHVFVGERPFFSWYRNFNSVRTISKGALAALPLGGYVLAR